MLFFKKSYILIRLVCCVIFNLPVPILSLSSSTAALKNDSSQSQWKPAAYHYLTYLLVPWKNPLIKISLCNLTQSSLSEKKKFLQGHLSKTIIGKCLILKCPKWQITVVKNTRLSKNLKERQQSSKLIYRFNAIPIKIPAGIFFEKLTNW